MQTWFVCALLCLACSAQVVLRAVTIEQPPFVIFDNSKTGNERYSGFYVDMFNELLKRLKQNMTYELYHVPDNTFGSFVNGSWTGIVGQLNTSKADVAFSPLTITADRVKAIDFSSPYLDIGLKLMIPKGGEKRNLFAFFAPFSWELWLLIIAASLVVALCTWIIDMLSPYGYRTRGENDLRFQGALFTSMLIMVGQSGAPGKGWSVRVITLCYFFFIVIVASTYTANLAAALTTKLSDNKLSSLADVKTYGYKLGIVRNSAPSSYFENNENVADVKRYLVYYDSYASMIEALRIKTVDAIAWVNVIVEYTANQRPCDTLEIGALFNKANYGIPLPKNSPYLQSFSNALLTMREDGTVERLYQRWWYEKGDCSQAAAQASQASSSVTIYDLAGVFLFLVMAIAVGIVILLFELCFSACCYKRFNSNPVIKCMDGFLGRTILPEKTVDEQLKGVNLMQAKSPSNTILVQDNILA